MIGFQSIVHQGWHAKRFGRDHVNPYPAGSAAAREWEVGFTRASFGAHWRDDRQKVEA